MSRIQPRRRYIFRSLALCLLPLCGCSVMEGLRGPQAISAHRVPRRLLGTTRSDMQEITMARLRQDPPEVYQLGPDDILGVYIENVIGNPDEVPPVHYPEDGSKPPAIGFPIPIREDGTIAAPLVPPIQVTGLTLAQTTELIRKAYTVEQKILPEGKDRIIVTLIRRRMHRVLVVREETGGTEGVSKRGSGFTVDLPAYENDLLHALNETGGLPGVDAKNEILIYRGMFSDGAERDRMIARINDGLSPCEAKPPIPGDPNVVVIPMRFHSNNVPEFTQDDIILESGDIVMIKAREREIYYTGGILGGGEYQLPRDYDLDILGAIALAGGQIGAGNPVPISGGRQGGFGGFGGGAGNGAAGAVPASKAIILRKLPDGTGQIPIRVDLNRALSDPGHRILIQPEDTIVVRYTIDEAFANLAFNLLQFNYFLGSGGGF